MSALSLLAVPGHTRGNCLIEKRWRKKNRKLTSIDSHLGRPSSSSGDGTYEKITSLMDVTGGLPNRGTFTQYFDMDDLLHQVTMTDEGGSGQCVGAASHDRSTHCLWRTPTGPGSSWAVCWARAGFTAAALFMAPHLQARAGRHVDKRSTPGRQPGDGRPHHGIMLALTTWWRHPPTSLDGEGSGNISIRRSALRLVPCEVHGQASSKPPAAVGQRDVGTTRGGPASAGAAPSYAWFRGDPVGCYPCSPAVPKPWKALVSPWTLLSPFSSRYPGSTLMYRACSSGACHLPWQARLVPCPAKLVLLTPSEQVDELQGPLPFSPNSS